MIFDVKNTKGKKVKVYDQTGLEIKTAFKYNTRTREVHMYLTGTSAAGKTRIVTTPVSKKSTYPRQVVKFKLKIPGSFIIVNGKKY